MLYGPAADLVVIVHVGFILFVAAGGFLAWRWRAVVWFHVPLVTYAAAIVTVGFDCPLTPLEKQLRRLAGDQVYAGGFVNHYLTNVIYPGGLTPYLRGLAALCVVIAYTHLAVGRRRGRRSSGGARVGVRGVAWRLTRSGRDGSPS